MKLRSFLIIALFGSLIAYPKAFSHEGSGKKALIFGVSGQDGIYLADFLLDKDYEVHGVKRSSIKNAESLQILSEKANKQNKRFFIHYGTLTDESSVSELIHAIQPDEIYNLAAQSHVSVSFHKPLYTSDVDGLGVLRILETIKELRQEKFIKFYQASSSEIFGKARETPQTEMTAHYPRSPYGVAKLFAYWMTVNYRESYGLFTCNGILFNHESPLRDETFVSRKIVLAACRYKYGLQDVLYLGNLDATRDWGYARDYVECMWLMLQQKMADDYIIATGETHSIREFVTSAYKYVGVEIEWEGSGLNEVGIDQKTGKAIVKIDPQFYRLLEVESICGDSSKAKNVLKWKMKTNFDDLLKIMISADEEKIKKEVISCF